jgi:hypothetical protein
MGGILESRCRCGLACRFVLPPHVDRIPDSPITGGVIDIFEGVNLATHNQMTLHTTAGCTQPQGVTQTGTQGNTNCDYSQNGCIVQDPNVASYGAAFSQTGGGVWVTEFAVTGINIWFFNVRTLPHTSV